MIINYLLDIANYTKCKNEEITGDFSLGELINALCRKYGDSFAEKILNGARSDIGEDIVILVNGKNVSLSNGIHTMLKDGDSVSILPAIMGG